MHDPAPVVRWGCPGLVLSGEIPPKTTKAPAHPPTHQMPRFPDNVHIYNILLFCLLSHLFVFSFSIIFLFHLTMQGWLVLIDQRIVIRDKMARTFNGNHQLTSPFLSGHVVVFLLWKGPSCFTSGLFVREASFSASAIWLSKLEKIASIIRVQLCYRYMKPPNSQLLIEFWRYFHPVLTSDGTTLLSLCKLALCSLEWKDVELNNLMK